MWVFSVLNCPLLMVVLSLQEALSFYFHQFFVYFLLRKLHFNYYRRDFLSYSLQSASAITTCSWLADITGSDTKPVIQHFARGINWPRTTADHFHPLSGWYFTLFCPSVFGKVKKFINSLLFDVQNKRQRQLLGMMPPLFVFPFPICSWCLYETWFHSGGDVDATQLLCNGNNAGWNTHNTVHGILFLLCYWFTLKNGMKIMTIMMVNATLLILHHVIAYSLLWET